MSEKLEDENKLLRKRVAALEQQLHELRSEKDQVLQPREEVAGETYSEAKLEMAIRDPNFPPVSTRRCLVLCVNIPTFLSCVPAESAA